MSADIHIPICSVIMPVYRTEATVAAAVASLLAQTMRDFELIAVNDGSPDQAGAILADYAAKDARVRVLTQSNRGQAAARNAGLNVARGKWIVFLDSDDALPPRALETLVGAVESAGVPFGAARGFVVVESESARDQACCGPDTRAVRAKVSSRPLETLVTDRRLRSSPWNKIYARDVLGDLRFPEGIVFEDWPFITLFAARVECMVVVEANCYVYSRFGGSTVRSAFTEHKATSYLKGIRLVAEALMDTSVGRIAARRCALAAAMLLSKTTHAKDDQLRKTVATGLSEILGRWPVVRRQLPLKARFRLWRLSK